MTVRAASMLRQAGPEDETAIDNFLSQHRATSMFLRSNLAAHGTQEAHAPHGTTFYVHATDAGIQAVLGISNSGYILAQAPDAEQALWQDFAVQVSGRSVCGMTGLPVQVQACLGALGLTGAPWQLNADEPLYHLDIARLDCRPATVRSATADELPLLETWFNAYEQDVGHVAPGTPASDAVKARAARAIGNPDVAVLVEDGVPVAMAGINARLPDIVQIGGVYTPAPLRGRGYAGRALAGLLRACAAQGVTQSVLFANNDPAARAYEALGYRLIGQYRVALLQAPMVIGDMP